MGASVVMDTPITIPLTTGTGCTAERQRLMGKERGDLLSSMQDVKGIKKD